VKVRELALLLLLPFSSPLGAQQGSAQEAPGTAREPRTDSYLIPEIVYVGDRARLVVQLEAEFAGAEPFTLEDPPELSRQGEIRIHRLELDYRRGSREAGGDASGSAGAAGRPRLLVDFTPYSPGLIELPPLPLGGGAGIGGLRVSIASVLESGKDPLVLSEPALPLSPPGSLSLVLAATLGSLLLLLGGAGGAFWARKNLGGFLETRRKRRLVALMRKTERRFRRELSGGGGDCRAVLGLVSAEFRDFLGRFTGYNCLAMSAGEFFALPLFSPDEASLGPFFRNLDRLRYSGGNPETADVRGVLDELRGFTLLLEKTLRGKAAR
jgi:hypothetical protein